MESSVTRSCICCAKQVSVNARTCPGCGEPNPARDDPVTDKCPKCGTRVERYRRDSPYCMECLFKELEDLEKKGV